MKFVRYYVFILPFMDLQFIFVDGKTRAFLYFDDWIEIAFFCTDIALPMTKSVDIEKM